MSGIPGAVSRAFWRWNHKCTTGITSTTGKNKICILSYKQ
ncbi:hypothetical protein E2C01_055734 [Portunus trituberculatus]|uniref:Uncharacterized protein n=1 Tax=Portunus trituberculatus TaxID=210409 RepID=A0A5B7GVT8_PORTR|nr:hypothetical protein [Portunus trituberculatus]